MGFATEEECQDFLGLCPEFERMLVRSGIRLLKYWFAVGEEEQERRLQDRMNDPAKRWKLSSMDLKSRLKWEEYSIARDEMFAKTDIEEARWHVVDANDKKRARLNCIRHLLGEIPYQDHVPRAVKLPPRPKKRDSGRRPRQEWTMVKDWYR